MRLHQRSGFPSFNPFRWRCDPERQARRRQERLARRVVHVMNSYVVPDVPPFTRRELVLFIVGAIVVTLVLTMLIVGAATVPPAH